MATKPRTKAETLAWLRTIAGELSTQTLKRLEDTQRVLNTILDMFTPRERPTDRRGAADPPK